MCNFWTGIVGLLGVLLGGVGTAWIQHYLVSKKQDQLDDARKVLLKAMLEDDDHEWRKLTTLGHVVGADDDTTKRLLLVLGARASEDGEPVWALLSRKPLPKSE